MINVMATDKLEFPYIPIKNHRHSQYQLSSMRNVRLKVDSKTSIQGSILHLITIPDLRAALIFHFQDTGTIWNVFEPYRAPLTKDEVRGALVLAIQQFREPAHSFVQTRMKSSSFVHSTKPIIQYLESLQLRDKVYIILVFKEVSFFIGNYFDETAACQAMVEYCPQKVETVIRTMEDNYLNRQHHLQILEKICYKKGEKDYKILGDD